MKSADFVKLLGPYARDEYQQMIAELGKERAQEYKAPQTRLKFLACRFCAWLDYQTYADSANSREWINLFQEGFKGYRTWKDVDGYLESLEPWDDEEQTMEQWLKVRLKEFFGR